LPISDDSELFEVSLFHFFVATQSSIIFSTERKQFERKFTCNIQQYLLMLSVIWGDSADGVDPENSTATIFQMNLGLK
jgi:hypothetical protein